MNRLNLRQKQIVETLAREGVVEAEKIQAEFGVSRPTVYRDFQLIVHAGLALRMPGGLALPADKVSTGAQELCVKCGRAVSPRTVFLVQLSPNQKITACCPHCGMMALGHHPEAISALATDYLYGTKVSVGQVVFLANSRVTLCCLPSVLSFGSVEDAKSFQQGFGGELMNLEALKIYIADTSQGKSGLLQPVVFQ